MPEGNARQEKEAFPCFPAARDAKPASLSRVKGCEREMDIKSRHQGTSSCRFIASLTGGEDHVPSVCKREKGGSQTQTQADLTPRETGSDADTPEIISQKMLMNLWERFLDSLSLMMMARIAAAVLSTDKSRCLMVERTVRGAVHEHTLCGRKRERDERRGGESSLSDGQGNQVSLQPSHLLLQAS